jgi:hypothetical protein
MRFQVLHKVSSYLMVASAFLCLALSGEIDPVTTLLGGMGIAVSWFWEPPRVRPDRWLPWWNAASLLVFLVTIVEVLSGGDIVLSFARFLVFLLIAKEVRKPTPSPRRGEGRGEGGSVPQPTGLDLAIGPTPSGHTTPVTDLRLPPHPSREAGLLPSGERGPENHFPRTLMWRTILVAVVLSARDMAGVATMSLMSIYLAKAFGLSTARIGFIVGTMMLSATIVNPIAVFFTPGKRRLPALSSSQKVPMPWSRRSDIWRRIAKKRRRWEPTAGNSLRPNSIVTSSPPRCLMSCAP